MRYLHLIIENMLYGVISGRALINLGILKVHYEIIVIQGV